MKKNLARSAMIVMVATVALAWSASISAQTPGPRVKLKVGTLEGAVSSDVESFKGIPYAQKSPPSLGGSSWQLVKFQSSDDTTLTPDDRSKYTLTFGNDGRVNARIDCNRGSGRWKSNGPNQLQVGPMALTRAMFPPGSIHDRIAKDLPAVRSYVIKDGHLFLSPMADGGIYEFEPIVSPGSLDGMKWSLTEIDGSVVKSDKAFIQFDSKTKRFSGHGGCNRVAGNYTVDGSHMNFSQVISTRMACIDGEIQKIETDFLKRLNEVTDFQIEGDVLRLFKDNQPALAFKAPSKVDK